MCPDAIDQGAEVVPDDAGGLRPRATEVAETWSRAPMVIRDAVERLLGLG